MPLVEDESLSLKGTEKERGDEQNALEDELASVEVEDTSTFLETLDSEVSMMVSNVFLDANIYHV